MSCGQALRVQELAPGTWLTAGETIYAFPNSRSQPSYMLPAGTHTGYRQWIQPTTAPPLTPAYYQPEYAQSTPPRKERSVRSGQQHTVHGTTPVPLACETQAQHKQSPQIGILPPK